MQNLAALYLSEPSRLAALKAIPRRGLTAYEVPILTAVHLRASDSKTSVEQHEHPAPKQTLNTLLALSAASTRNRLKSMDAVQRQQQQQQQQIPVAEPNSESNLQPPQAAQQAQQQQQHRACAAHSSLEFNEPLDNLFLQSTDRRRIRRVVRLEPNPDVCTTDSIDSAALDLSSHWTETIGRRHFLRNSPASVAAFVEIWVIVPFDTVLERFLSLAEAEDNDEEEDFVALALRSRPALRRRIMQHLVGELSELTSTLLVFPCRLIPGVLVSECKSKNDDNDGNTAVPEIIKAHDAETEWRAAKMWTKDCRLELEGELPFWIFGLSPDSTTSQKQQQQIPERRGREQEAVFSALSSSCSSMHCMICRSELLKSIGHNEVSNFGLVWVILPTLLWFGLGAGWVERAIKCEEQVLRNVVARNQQENRSAETISTSFSALKRIRAFLLSPSEALRFEVVRGGGDAPEILSLGADDQRNNWIVEFDSSKQGAVVVPPQQFGVDVDLATGALSIKLFRSELVVVCRVVKNL